jgi:hypothetical protein
LVECIPKEIDGKENKSLEEIKNYFWDIMQRSTFIKKRKRYQSRDTGS